jgi:hypothetical protein
MEYKAFAAVTLDTSSHRARSNRTATLFQVCYWAGGFARCYEASVYAAESGI